MPKTLKRKMTRVIPSIPLRITTKKVAAYCRVSMDCDKLKNSFMNQIDYYKKLINANPRYEFAGIYYDYGISGTTTHRQGFNEMISNALDGKIDIILTKSISRFARNNVDLLNTVRQLRDKDISIRFEKENIDTLTADGELMLSILGNLAQSESESISSNAKWAIRKRFEMGYEMKRPLFGYDYKNKNFTINDKEANIVKLIFTEFLNGKTYTEIASIVNDLGIKTRNNNIFHIDAIRDILSQSKYAGFTICQKRYVISPLTHKSKRNNGEVPMYRIDGTHPKIIDETIFNKAQEKRNYISENKAKCHKQSKWYTGLFKCPLCGGCFATIDDKYIGCTNHKKHRTCENYTRIPIEWLKKIVNINNLNKIKEIIVKPVRKQKVSRVGRAVGDNASQFYFNKDDYEIIYKT